MKAVVDTLGYWYQEALGGQTDGEVYFPQMLAPLYTNIYDIPVRKIFTVSTAHVVAFNTQPKMAALKGNIYL